MGKPIPATLLWEREQGWEALVLSSRESRKDAEM